VSGAGEDAVADGATGEAEAPEPVVVPYDESYYQANGQYGDRPALRLYVRLVRRYVGAGPYLDFGCGTGHLLRRLSQVGPAAGFEISPFSAARARQTAPGCQVSTSVDDLPDGGFAGVTAIHVLEHLDDDVADSVLATFHRVLRPGGRALIVTPDSGGRAHQLLGDRWSGFDDPTHINLKTHEQWRSFLGERGFSVLREGTDGLWNPPYGRLPRLADAAVHSGPALAQFLAGRLILRPGGGESSIFVIERV
jgi:SAM-dependent methyltransferase